MKKFFNKNRESRYRYWLISRHDMLGVDSFVFGPFKDEAKAANYPNTFLGWVDNPAFGFRYSQRVVRLPKGEHPDAPQAMWCKT